jgi:hypothetical protein
MTNFAGQTAKVSDSGFTDVSHFAGVSNISGDFAISPGNF